MHNLITEKKYIGRSSFRYHGLPGRVALLKFLLGILLAWLMVQQKRFIIIAILEPVEAEARIFHASVAFRHPCGHEVMRGGISIRVVCLIYCDDLVGISLFFIRNARKI